MLIRAALLVWVEWIISGQLNNKKSAVRRFFLLSELEPYCHYAGAAELFQRSYYIVLVR